MLAGAARIVRIRPDVARRAEHVAMTREPGRVHELEGGEVEDHVRVAVLDEHAQHRGESGRGQDVHVAAHDEDSLLDCRKPTVIPNINEPVGGHGRHAPVPADIPTIAIIDSGRRCTRPPSDTDGGSAVRLEEPSLSKAVSPYRRGRRERSDPRS